MKTIFLLVFFCCTTVLSFAQCGDITFSDQKSIDNFHANYPGCTILGYVTISGPDITDLDGLLGVTVVTSLTIKNNPALSSLSGLSLVYNNWKLIISDNPLLKTLTGLNALKNISEGLFIQRNNMLTSIAALHLVGSGDISPRYVTIADNIVLANLEGLENIKSSVSELIISNIPNLVNLHGLEAINDIFNLYIINNKKLVDIDALSNVRSLYRFEITNNPSLTSIQGLSGITYLDRFDLDNNDMLRSIAGLENLKGIGQVYIVNNSRLSSCSIESICNFLFTTERKGNIGNNKAGCNSQDEVMLNCNRAPADLEYFTVEINKSNNWLYVGAALGYDYTGFSIEGSTDGHNFAEISYVNPADAYRGRYFEFIHQAPADIMYYRIKQIYTNGTSFYSSVRSAIRAQCGTGNFTFTSQAQINAFAAQSPGCKNVVGSLTVSGPDIVSLAGLSSIETVSATINISSNPQLTTLKGLEKLVYTDDLRIKNNPLLTDLTGLSGLETIFGQLTITNTATADLGAFSGLTKVGETILLEGNTQLATLGGLDNVNLGSLQSFTILNSPKLSACNVRSVCAFLSDPSHVADIANNAPGCNSRAEISSSSGCLALAPGNIRINAGGAAFTASSSRTFGADQYFTGTTQISNASAGDILNTTDDQLYKEQRFGSSFSYNIPVESGSYNVVLHFAENYWGVPARGGSVGTAKRRFHVNMEGSRKLTNYDIFTSAGAAMRAKTETITVSVTDGILNISFLTGAADKPIIAAIEVLPAPVVLTPLADAYVRNIPYEIVNYGLATTLEVKTGGKPDYQRSTYLKFPLTGVSQVGSAKLRLYGNNIQTGSNISLSAYGVSNDSWTETGINWLNAPAASGAALGSVNVTSLAKYYEIDVTAFVQSQLAGDKTVSFLVNNPASQNAQLSFNSRENAANPPQLVITASPAPAARIGSEPDMAQSEINSEPQVSAVFPNPAGKRFSVYISKAHEGKIDLQLINLSGNAQPLSTAQPVLPASNVEVDVSSMKLPAGIYVMKIQSATLTEMIKVLLTE